jgi:hypothetical protein
MKKVAKRLQKTGARWLPYIIAIYITVGIASHLTNPFTRYTIVRMPFQTSVGDDGQLQLVEEGGLRLRKNRLYGVFVWLKSGYHIVQNVYTGGKPSKAETLNEVISDIHKLRFDPNEPYIISGDHFSTLYIRSLGIFYHTLLDPRTALNDEDWINRQKIYLQTTAYALDVFKDSDRLSTTIVPVGVNSVSLMNVYSTPSDTLYSLLYALDTMMSSSTLENIYPMKTLPKYQLQTQHAALALLNANRTDLQRHYKTYLDTVVDPETTLVRKDILLSGTKDIAKRESAFYDNIMLWKTHQLAQKLNLTESNPAQLEQLKQKILSTYWSPEMGCFLEDQSQEAIDHKYYSSDWLIILKTGFLDPFQDTDRKYYIDCVSYIQKERIDQPFGLKYQQEIRKHRLHNIVRMTAPEYGSTTIWSNWGMEYIKLLVLLSETTQQPEYLKHAEQQLNSYTDKIVEYGCYPEVYDGHGRMFKNFLYKSVCQTGWVVTYEQAKAMIDSSLRYNP